MHHLIFSILDCCSFGQPIFEAQHGPTHLYTSFVFTFPELSSFPTKNSAFDPSNSLPLRALCYSIWSLGTTTMLEEIVVAFCSQQLMVLSVVSGVTVVYQQMSRDIEYLEKKLAIEFQPICDSHPILVMNYENDMTFQECYADSRRDHEPSCSFVSEGNFPLRRHWHFQSHHGSAPGQWTHRCRSCFTWLPLTSGTSSSWTEHQPSDPIRDSVLTCSFLFFVQHEHYCEI